MPECAFCQPHANGGEFLLSTRHWYVIRDADGAKGHALMIPWRHVDEFLHLTPPETEEFGSTIDRLFTRFAVTTYQLQINGPGYRHIRHLHVHVRSKTAFALPIPLRYDLPSQSAPRAIGISHEQS